MCVGNHVQYMLVPAHTDVGHLFTYNKYKTGYYVNYYTILECHKYALI